MFDGVGRSQDPGATGRQVRSAVVTITLCVVAALAVGLRSRSVGVRAMPLRADDLVELTLPSDDTDIAEPLPAAPPRADSGTLGGDSGLPDTGYAEDALPEDAVDDPQGLSPSVAAGVADARPDHPPGGANGGGGPSGSGSADAAQVVPTSPQPAPVVVELSAAPLRVRRRRRPQYPPVAQRMNYGVVVCELTVFVDADGEARDVRYDQCPQVFHAHARAAMYEWRWESFEPRGARDWRQVEVSLTFEP